jgi:hypothetical protein
VDGVHVTAKAFKTNLYFYKSIGGAVEVRADSESRRWWCAWLCKTPDSAKAERIEIENVYYARFENTPVLIEAAQHARTCTNSSGCTLKHWATGVGVKITFPAGSTTPAGLPDLLPLDGVVSRAVVTVKGRTLRFETASGTHPG